MQGVFSIIVVEEIIVLGVITANDNELHNPFPEAQEF